MDKQLTAMGNSNSFFTTAKIPNFHETPLAAKVIIEHEQVGETCFERIANLFRFEVDEMFLGSVRVLRPSPTFQERERDLGVWSV